MIGSIKVSINVLRGMFVLLAVVASVRSADCSESDLQPRPSCGARSVLTWLALQNRDARISEINAEFNKHGTAAPTAETNVGQILQVLESRGCAVEALLWPATAHAVSLLPLPCIVHLVDPISTQPEHFTVLVKVEDGRVWFMDAAGDQIVSDRTVEQFLQAWDGVTIQTASGAGLLRTAQCIVVGAVAFFLMCLARSMIANWRRSATGPTVTMLIAVLGPCLGCSSESSGNAEKSIAIEIQQPTRQLGALKTLGRHTETFRFKVVSPKPVEISQILACCGMRVVDDTIIGRKLQPETEHSFDLEFEVSEGMGTSTKMATVKFTDAKVSPAVVAMVSRYLGPPKLESNRMAVDVELSGTAQTTLVSRRWRHPSDPSLQLLIGSSKSEDFAVKEVRQLTESVGQFGELVDCDVTKILASFTAGNRPRGDHSVTVPLVWSDGTIVNASVLMRVRPRAYAEPDHVYLGTVKPGGTKRVTVRLKYLSNAESRANRVTCTSPQLNAALDAGGDVVTIEFSAPMRAGRMDSKVHVGFDSPAIPELTVTVGAIIQGEANDATSVRSRD